MPDVQTTVMIDRPVVEVFEYLCDVERFPEWVPFLVKSRITKPPFEGEPSHRGFGKGLQFENVVGVPPMTVSFATEVVGYSWGRMVAYRDLRLPMSSTYTLRATGFGTVLSGQNESFTMGLLDFLRPATGEWLSRAMANLKTRLEAQDRVLPRPDIFFSYRRADMEYVGGRVFAVLEREFGEGRVFRDIDSIDVGARFDDRIRDVLANCSAVVAPIGAQWLEEIKKRNKTKKVDWVRKELRIALELAAEGKLLVLPVLLGAEMLKAKELKREAPELEELSGLQTLRLRPDPDFDADLEKLIRAIWSILRKQDLYS